MWFLFAMITVLAWGGADAFYKKGSDSDDKYSHIKIAVAVGFVMGIHALIYYFAKGVEMTAFDIVRYLPVSVCYILSMVIGYVGLRYLALSIASPVQNTSGVLVALLCVIFFQATVGPFEFAGIVLITVGMVGLGILENRYGERVDLSLGDNKKYRISFLAILIPVLYCIIDALGTFGDAIYLDELSLISEDAALISYETTFFVVGLFCLIFLLIKGGAQRRKLRLSAEFGSEVVMSGDETSALRRSRVKLRPRSEAAKGMAAVLETAGQFTYVFAMSANAVVAAPLVACYSVFSVIFSRIFLREKLKASQYAAIIVVLLGIMLLGIAEGISG